MHEYTGRLLQVLPGLDGSMSPCKANGFSGRSSNSHVQYMLLRWAVACMLALSGQDAGNGAMQHPELRRQGFVPM